MSVAFQLSPHQTQRLMKRSWGEDENVRRKRPCPGFTATTQAWASPFNAAPATTPAPEFTLRPSVKRGVDFDNENGSPHKRFRSESTAFQAAPPAITPVLATPSPVAAPVQPVYDPTQMQLVAYRPPESYFQSSADLGHDNRAEQEREQQDQAAYKSVSDLLANDVNECRVLSMLHHRRNTGTPADLPTPSTSNQLVLYRPPPVMVDITDLPEEEQARVLNDVQLHESSSEDDMMID